MRPDTKANTSSLIRSLPHWAGFASGILLLFLLWYPFTHIHWPVIYDEGVYIGLSRTMSDSGLPIREDFPEDQIMVTHPPLVYGANGLAQKIFGQDVFTIRTIHIFLFTLPTIGLIAIVAYFYGGVLALFFALLALLGHGHFLLESHNLTLNFPLGGFSLLALWAFSLSCEKDNRARRQLLVLAFFFLALVKFQAIAVVGALLIWAFGVYSRESLKGIQPLKKHLFLSCLAFFLAALVALAYFLTAAPEAMIQKFSEQFDRLNSEQANLIDTLKRIRWISLQSFKTLDPSIIGALFVVLVFIRPRSRFTTISLCFVFSTLLFNLLVMRLPGAGTYYLYALIPTICVVIGTEIAKGLREISKRKTSYLLIILLVMKLWLDLPPLHFQVSYPQVEEKTVGEFIQENPLGAGGILTTSPSVGAYAQRRVALYQYFSDELFLMGLNNEFEQPIDYLVTGKDDWESIKKRPEGESITNLVATKFIAVKTTPRYTVYQRRP